MNKPVNTDGSQGPNGHEHGHDLNGADGGAQTVGQHPSTQHVRGEGERNAEDGHGYVRDGQIEQILSQFLVLSAEQYGNGHRVGAQ